MAQPRRSQRRTGQSASEGETVRRGLKRIDREDLESEELNCISLRIPSEHRCDGCVRWKDTKKGKADKDGAVTDRADFFKCHRLWLAGEEEMKKKNTRKTKRDQIAAQINFVEEYVVKPAVETVESDDEDDEEDEQTKRSGGASRVSSMGTHTTSGTTKSRALCGDFVDNLFCEKDPYLRLDEDIAEVEAQLEQTYEQDDDDEEVLYSARGHEGEEIEVVAESQMSEMTMVSPAKSKKQKRTVELNKWSVKSFGEVYEVDGVPATHVVIQKRLLTCYKQDAEIVRDMRKNLSRRKKFDIGGSLLLRGFLATALAVAPALAQQAAAIFIPLVIMWFLHWLSPILAKELTGEEIIRVCPSRSAMRNLMMDAGTDCMVDVREELQEAKHMAFSGDKGEKKHVDHFAKAISWWSAIKKRVCYFVLDIDGTGGNTEDHAEGILTSVKKLGMDVVKFIGQSTDSGGGGVLDCLAEALRPRGLCHTPNFVLNCTLHAFQLSLKNSIEEFFRQGKVKEKTVMQMLFASFYFCDRYDITEWKGMVEMTLESKEVVDATTLRGNEDCEPLPDLEPYIPETPKMDEKLPKPVLTRWWTVGSVASTHFEKYKLILEMARFAHRQCAAQGKSDSAASQTAQDLISMMDPDNEDSPVLHMHLTFIVGFHREWFIPHFDFLQGSDDVAKVPSFMSRHVLGRYFLAHSELTELLDAETLRNKRHFGYYKQSRAKIGGDSDKTWADEHLSKMDIIEDGFIRTSLASLEKHFDRWSGDLLLLSLAAEAPIARAVAVYMLRVVLDDSDARKDNLASFSVQHFMSPNHDCQFDLEVLETFLTERGAGEESIRNQIRFIGQLVLEEESDENAYERHFGKGLSILFEIASGGDMWSEEEPSELLQQFMNNFALPVVAIMASNTQFVERMIKEAALCSSTGRGELMRTLYAMIRSRFVHLPKPDSEKEENEDGEAVGDELDDAEPAVMGTVTTTTKKTKKLSEADRCKALIDEVYARTKRLKDVERDMGADNYKLAS